MNVVFKRHDKDVLNALDAQVEQALLAIGSQAEGHAKQELHNNPEHIDTALLLNSITYAVAGETPHITSYKSNDHDKNNKPVEVKTGHYEGVAPPLTEPAVYVGTNVEYAPYIHDGTRKIKNPNKFLRNAVTNYAEEYEGIAKKFLSGGAQ